MTVYPCFLRLLSKPPRNRNQRCFSIRISDTSMWICGAQDHLSSLQNMPLPREKRRYLRQKVLEDRDMSHDHQSSINSVQMIMS